MTTDPRQPLSDPLAEPRTIPVRFRRRDEHDMTAPDQYCGQAVPDAIARQWRRPAAARWRRTAYLATNRPYPPTEHTQMAPPAGMCALHLAHWRSWRGHRFDPISGNRWPGTPGSPFDLCDSNLADLAEQRRVEWDQRTLDQMTAIEDSCSTSRGCADTPDILCWEQTRPRVWEAVADGLRFTVDATGLTPYPDCATPSGAAYLTVEHLDTGARVHHSRHPHDRPARAAAVKVWRALSVERAA